MSKRLQVLLDEREFRELARTAKRMNLTLSEWVRRSLRAAAARSPVGDTRKKLAAVRAAVACDFPAPDVERMNEEIERGYRVGWDGD